MGTLSLSSRTWHWHLLALVQQPHVGVSTAVRPGGAGDGCSPPEVPGMAVGPPGCRGWL